MMKEAKYWVPLGEEKVQCHLCPHHCLLRPEKEGICKNKKNVAGKLFAHRYGEISALAMDPVEKKPLYHFYPGRGILSVGTIGCNLACSFCQNYHLVTGRVSSEPLPPEELIAAAKRERSFAIAYTYNEPFISFEYVLDCAKLARAAGLKNVLVTNGYYNPEPFAELLPWVDAMNIDLKAVRDDFYKKLCHGRVEPVKATILTAAKSCLVEITNLVVTGANDTDAEFEELAEWVAGISPDIPLHFSAYHPMYKLNNPPTPLSRLLRAYEIAKSKLHYVYLGNVLLDQGQDSVCPYCAAVLVHRRGYAVQIKALQGNLCGNCRRPVHFVND